MSAQLQFEVKPRKLFIGGEWRDPLSGQTFETINPATGEPITQVALASDEDVDLAAQAARKAFEEGPWTKMSSTDRGKILWKIGDLLMQNADEMAYLETLDCGKPISESRHIDIPMVAELFQYYAGWTTKIHGETIPVKGPFLNYTLREPVGIVAAITPWNFPLLLASWKIAAALAAGNTVILKPSEETPLSALRLAEIVQEAGLPAGAFNVVTGAGEVGAALVRHPGVDKIAFTGSTATGQQIMREAAGTLKKVTLELGGKSPNIVLADADLDRAVRGAFLGIFYNNGQVCTAGSRLFVEESIHDQLLEQLVARTKKTAPGDPLHPKTRLGPIANKAQFEKVTRYVEIGKDEGAKLIVGGDRPQIDDGKGYFFNPTIFDDVDNRMRIAQEEIFGPVLATIRVKDINDAIRQANETIYGLAAAVWTRDIKKAHRLARELKAGTVWINTYNMYDVASPFGGYKQSGFGRELGMHALEHYTQVKSVWVDLSE
ncbi:MAG: betaine-aldehyde dehydrogenase [Acidobacteria bacterium]|nr:betaine-aldehyde dehydrogenase [Acidobacteriota bacterium]